MSTMPAAAAQPLSYWWRVLAIVTMLFALAMCLGYLALWPRRDLAMTPKPVSAE
jgi:hypothetical protein